MKVLLVDDHPLFLEGLKNLLTIRGIDVVGTAADGWQALEKTRALMPDVILMDVIMPGCDGLTAMRLIKAEWPDIRVVMLTMSERDDDLFSAIKSGACGYLLKTEDTDRFFRLLEGLLQGETPLSSGLATRILEEFAQRTQAESCVEPEEKDGRILTDRQIQVLTLAARGLTYKEIGSKLFLSERTIKYHMGEIVGRLHLKNRRQAVDYARSMNFIKP